MRRSVFLATALLLTAAPTMCLSPFASATPGVDGWLTPRLIESEDLGSAYVPRVAVDPLGNGFAVWYQSDGVSTNIWANHFTPSAGWGVATLLEDRAGNATRPEIALGGDGSAVAVWSQLNATNYEVWGNRFTAGWGWSGPMLVESEHSYGGKYPVVAADAEGNAMVVWDQSDGVDYSIWARRYAARSGWENTTLIESNTRAAFLPRVAAGGDGSVVAVWIQRDGAGFSAWANRFTSAAGWGNATLLETDNSEPAYYPEVAVDARGNAVVVWYQDDGVRTNIWANRFTPSAGWGNATLLENDDAGDANSPRVAADASGNLLVVWQQSDGAIYHVWTKWYDSASGWGNATLLENDDAEDANAPRVAADANGNLLVVWQQSDGAIYHVWARWYDSASGWGNATRIDLESVGGAQTPDVALDAAGNALVVWRQADASVTSIYSNRYVAVDEEPPALTLSEPNDGNSTDQPSIWVAGVTEPGAALVINGMAVAVGPDGSFRILVPLAPGHNTVAAAAKDRAGNMATLAVNVTFYDPRLTLEANITAAQAALASALADLAEARLDLENSTAQLSALQGLLAETLVKLDGAEANLSDAQARLDALEASGNATQVELDAARANATAAQAQVDSLTSEQAALRAQLADSNANVTVQAGTLAYAKVRVDSLSSALNDSQVEAARVRDILNETLSSLSETQSSLDATRASHQSAIDTFEASASTALLLGAMGMILGLAGVATGFMKNRLRGGDQGGSTRGKVVEGRNDGKARP